MLVQRKAPAKKTVASGKVVPKDEPKAITKDEAAQSSLKDAAADIPKNAPAKVSTVPRAMPDLAAAAQAPSASAPTLPAATTDVTKQPSKLDEKEKAALALIIRVTDPSTMQSSESYTEVMDAFTAVRGHLSAPEVFPHLEKIVEYFNVLTLTTRCDNYDVPVWGKIQFDCYVTIFNKENLTREEIKWCIAGILNVFSLAPTLDPNVQIMELITCAKADPDKYFQPLLAQIKSLLGMTLTNEVNNMLGRLLEACELAKSLLEDLESKKRHADFSEKLNRFKKSMTLLSEDERIALGHQCIENGFFDEAFQCFERNSLKDKAGAGIVALIHKAYSQNRSVPSNWVIAATAMSENGLPMDALTARLLANPMKRFSRGKVAKSLYIRSFLLQENDESVKELGQIDVNNKSEYDAVLAMKATATRPDKEYKQAMVEFKKTEGEFKQAKTFLLKRKKFEVLKSLNVAASDPSQIENRFDHFMVLAACAKELALLLSEVDFMRQDPLMQAAWEEVYSLYREAEKLRVMMVDPHAAVSPTVEIERARHLQAVIELNECKADDSCERKVSGYKRLADQKKLAEASLEIARYSWWSNIVTEAEAMHYLAQSIEQALASMNIKIMTDALDLLVQRGDIFYKNKEIQAAVIKLFKANILLAGNEEVFYKIYLNFSKMGLANELIEFEGLLVEMYPHRFTDALMKKLDPTCKQSAEKFTEELIEKRAKQQVLWAMKKYIPMLDKKAKAVQKTRFTFQSSEAIYEEEAFVALQVAIRDRDVAGEMQATIQRIGLQKQTPLITFFVWICADVVKNPDAYKEGNPHKVLTERLMAYRAIPKETLKGITLADLDKIDAKLKKMIPHRQAVAVDARTRAMLATPAAASTIAKHIGVFAPDPLIEAKEREVWTNKALAGDSQNSLNLAEWHKRRLVATPSKIHALQAMMWFFISSITSKAEDLRKADHAHNFYKAFLENDAFKRLGLECVAKWYTARIVEFKREKRNPMSLDPTYGPRINRMMDVVTKQQTQPASDWSSLQLIQTLVPLSTEISAELRKDEDPAWKEIDAELNRFVTERNHDSEVAAIKERNKCLKTGM